LQELQQLHDLRDIDAPPSSTGSHSSVRSPARVAPEQASLLAGAQGVPNLDISAANSFDNSADNNNNQERALALALDTLVGDENNITNRNSTASGQLEAPPVLPRALSVGNAPVLPDLHAQFATPHEQTAARSHRNTSALSSASAQSAQPVIFESDQFASFRTDSAGSNAAIYMNNREARAGTGLRASSSMSRIEQSSSNTAALSDSALQAPPAALKRDNGVHLTGCSSQPALSQESVPFPVLTAESSPTSNTNAMNGAGTAAGLSPRRLIVVSNRLPVTIGTDSAGRDVFSQSSGGLVSALAGVKQELPFVWVGWPGTFFARAEKREELRERLLRERRCVPVFLTEHIAELYYNGFCNDILWPLFHYVPLPVINTHGERKFDSKFWHAYRAANLAFADTVLSIYQPGDLIWVQDYHLMVMPALLRARRPRARIGFFLHTPFPSSDVFRVLPVAPELLRSVLHSDLLGFHTYDYAHHFLSACSRLLGLQTSHKGVDCGTELIHFDRSTDSEASLDGSTAAVASSSLLPKTAKSQTKDAACGNGREQTDSQFGAGHEAAVSHFAHVGIFPIGIDPSAFHRALESTAVRERVAELRDTFEGRRIVLGVDRLDYIKGVPHKLRAFERMLARHPEWRDGNVVLIQIGVPSRTEVDEYKKLIAQTNELVAAINGKYGSVDASPIVFINQSVNFHDLCALYSVAEVCIVTSIRDGMNLVSSEFIVCQSQNHGVLVLSEFAGSVHSLSGAIRVNPWNTDELASALHEALSLDQSEREIRHWKLYRYVTTYTAAHWATSFVTELKIIARRVEQQLALEQQHAASRPLSVERDLIDKAWRRPVVAPASTDPQSSFPERSPSTEPVTASKPSATILPSSSPSNRVSAQVRLFVFTYEDTLRPAHSLAHLDAPGAHLTNTLAQLCSDKRNRVYLFSARSSGVLDAWFGTLPIGLVAEHGCAVRPHGRDSKWVNLLRSGTSGGGGSAGGTGGGGDGEDALPWLQQAMPILQYFTERTPGSQLEVKQFSVAWHFDDAHPQFGSWQAYELREHLSEMCAQLGAEVVVEKKTLVLKPAEVSKVGALRRILKSLEKDGVQLSLIFAMSSGSAKPDEELFSFLRDLSANNFSQCHVLACKVGNNSLHADRAVPSIQHAVDALDNLNASAAALRRKPGHQRSRSSLHRYR